MELARRLIEDQDPRVHHQRAGDGDALSLPARYRRAALADDRVAALGQFEVTRVDAAPEGAGPSAPPRRAGLEAEIKVDTFNFTKYGLLHGTVQNVSADSIDRSKPLGYR